jgi:membrane carboxypeptidase/penicillin-binding protein
MEPKTVARRSTEEVYRTSKPVDQMTPAELCEAASDIRERITTSAEKLSVLYSMLYAKVRRSPDDMTYAYLAVANAGRRLSGVILQATHRTESMEGRALLLASRDVEDKERWRKEEAQRKERAANKRAESERKRSDPLEALYGISYQPTEAVEIDPEVARSFAEGEANEEDFNELYGEEQ